MSKKGSLKSTLAVSLTNYLDASIYKTTYLLEPQKRILCFQARAN